MVPLQLLVASLIGWFQSGQYEVIEYLREENRVLKAPVFVIDLHSRRVHLVSSTPHPDEAFMLQIARYLTDATDGVLQERRFLICDRDRKWSTAVRYLLETSGVRVIRTPYRAPNGNAHAERFVRSIKDECLNRVNSFRSMSGHLRKILAEWVPHYNRGRPHASLGPGIPEPSGLTVSRAVDHQLPHRHRVVAKPILAGLHHEYRLESIAA